MKCTGKREEIEKWMKDNDIAIALIQETSIDQNTREARKEYTWYFSGENGRKEYTAGGGIVMRNDYTKHIEDIEPVDDRLITLTLKSTLKVKNINTYMPQADRPNEEKDKVYQQTRKELRKHKNKGPTYIGGDFNARLQDRLTIQKKHA